MGDDDRHVGSMASWFRFASSLWIIGDGTSPHPVPVATDRAPTEKPMARLHPLLRPVAGCLSAAALFPLFLTVMTTLNPQGGIDWRDPSAVPLVRWFWLGFFPLASVVCLAAGSVLVRWQPTGRANRWLLAAFVAIVVSVFAWLVPIPDNMLPVTRGELAFHLAVLGAMVGAGAYRMGFEREEQ